MSTQLLALEAHSSEWTGNSFQADAGYQDLVRASMATKLQAWCRMCLAIKEKKRRLRSLQLSNAAACQAAVAIQALQRGRRVRMTPVYRDVQTAIRSLRERRRTGAIRLQALWRGYRVRKKLRAIRAAALMSDDEEDFEGVDESFFNFEPVADFELFPGRTKRKSTSI